MTSAVAIAAGGYHGLALDRQGRVHAWGANSYGQLGRSSADVWNSKLPLVVPGLPSIVAIAAGEEHSLALDRQGRVWAWGKNSTGQLGDGTTAHRHAPALVALDRVIAISAGSGHCLAVRADGGVSAWGDNAVGQLGNGTIVSSALPVPVTGLDAVVGVSALAGTSMALRNDRTVWGRGSNYVGAEGGAVSAYWLDPVYGCPHVHKVVGEHHGRSPSSPSSS